MSNPEICVVGSVNLDIVVAVGHHPAPGETVLGGDRTELHGGKGANQAVAAARWAGRWRLVGRVGDDDSGRAACGTASVVAGVDVLTWLTVDQDAPRPASR